MNWWQFIIFLICFFCCEYFLSSSSSGSTVASEEASAATVDPGRKEEDKKKIENIVVNVPSIDIQYDVIEVDNYKKLDDDVCYINYSIYELENVYGRFGLIVRIFDDYLVLKDLTSKTKYYILTEKKYLTESDYKRENNIDNINSVINGDKEE